MELTLSDVSRKKYEGLIKSAQDIESSMGNIYYRLSKFVLMRNDVDLGLKEFWADQIKEFNLDPAKDYMVKDGKILDVSKPKFGAAEAEVRPVETEKPATVEDLK